MTILVSCGIIVIMIGSLIDCLKKRKAARERLSDMSDPDDLERSQQAGRDVVNQSSWSNPRSTRSGDCLGKPVIYSPQHSKFETISFALRLY